MLDHIVLENADVLVIIGVKSVLKNSQNSNDELIVEVYSTLTKSCMWSDH